MNIKAMDSVIGINDYCIYPITDVYGKVIFVTEESVLIEFDKNIEGHAASNYFLANNIRKLKEGLEYNCIYIPYSRWDEFIKIKECYTVDII